jgi:hypothetical protein
VRRADRLHHWRRAFLLEDGSVIAIFAAKGIIKIDQHSKLVWSQSAAAHHDAHILANGDIYSLVRVSRLLPRVHPRRPIAEDFITVLDGATGQVKRDLSLIEALERSDHRALWDGRKRRGGDVLHTNSIKVLDERTPAFAPGQVLVSSRTLNALVVVDLEAGKAVWTHQGPYRRQHDARPRANGKLLVFDNQSQGERSRIVEIDPVNRGTRVVYDGGNENPFYSRHCGAARTLPNGNLLIVATSSGRAFEIDDRGVVVWDYHNPHRIGDQDQFVASLFDVIRVTPEHVASWLQPVPTSPED